MFHIWSPYCFNCPCMATTHPLAPPPHEQANRPINGVEDGISLDQSLVPSPHAPQDGEAIALTAQIGRLPVELDVSVRNFRVRNLLALEPSHLIESGWGHGEDVPLSAGEVQLAWSEFEVVDTQLAVRMTRLA
jgi:flagellar motor switch/type III secretory pathway protein FliN